MSKGARNRQTRSSQKASIDNSLVQHLLNDELKKATRRFFEDETACILWVLHSEFGFGKDRLKRFYDSYERANDDLRKYYDSSVDDLPYLAKDQLMRIGVDLDEWEKHEGGDPTC